MSKTKEAIKLAHEKGYYINAAGEVYSHLGKKRKLAESGRSVRYLYFTIHLRPGESFPIPVHQLQAYQKFKDKLFEPGILVRHLNGNSLDNSWDNLALGSGSENANDRKPADRKQHAQLAARSQKRCKSDEFWDMIRSEYQSGMGYKKLEKKYGISRSTLSYRLSKTAKKKVQPTLKG